MLELILETNGNMGSYIYFEHEFDQDNNYFDYISTEEPALEINNNNYRADHIGNRDAMPQQIKSVSKVYADVLKNKDSSYYDVDSFTPEYDDINKYSLTRKLGSGKYSLVFQGIKEENKGTVVIKILKPVRKRKVKREIKILECLRGGINIVNLLAVVSIPNTGTAMTALIFEHLDKHEDFKNVYLTLSEEDMRYYLYELLRALDYCHSHGIMHRDVKPHNVIVYLRRRLLRLIDWGLAEFYNPGDEYNTRVASRYFKGPELLVEYVYYDYSLDMWSFGCIFAQMLFRKDPFFHGSDNCDQLLKIVKVLGTQDLYAYLKRYNIHIDSNLQGMLGYYDKKKWQRYITTENEYLVDNYALDLLDNLLRIDHAERLTAKEAMKHKYFSEIRGKSESVHVPTTHEARVGC